MTDSAARELGERVRETRHAKRLSQMELARKAGVSRDALVRLELGQRKSRVSTIGKIADALGVSAEYFGIRKPPPRRVIAMGAPQRESADDERTLRALSFKDEHQDAVAAPVSRDPRVLGGAVVFAGTRVPVEILVDYLVTRDTLDSFLEDFPTVSNEQATGYLRMTPEAVEKTLSDQHRTERDTPS